MIAVNEMVTGRAPIVYGQYGSHKTIVRQGAVSWTDAVKTDYWRTGVLGLIVIDFSPFASAFISNLTIYELSVFMR
jgi:hypothetical protein